MYLSSIQFDSDEQILLMVRKHWFIITVRLLSVVLIALLPLFGFVGLLFLPFMGALIGVASTQTLIGVYAAWLLICWMMLFGIWTNYYLDIWTITSKRLITADQRGLFNRHTGSFRLERLQDINVNVRGIIATFLEYGDLEAETASEDQHFVAFNIPHPQEVKALMMRTADNVTFTDRAQPQESHDDDLGKNITTNGGL